MLDHFGIDQLHNELRGIFACMAEQVCVVAGGDAANAFLGLDLYEEHDGPLDYAFPADRFPDIDPGRFPITEIFEDVHRTVFSPNSDEDLPFEIEEAAMAAFLRAMPQQKVDGDRPAYLSREGKAVQLAEYAMAVARILRVLWGAYRPGQRLGLSAREIALLGQLNEGTVRNAMSGKKAAMKPFVLPDGSAWVPVEVALRWLSERRGYRPRPVPLTHVFGLTPDKSPSWFATALHWNAGSAARIADELGWDEADVQAALNGEFPQDEFRQRRLAEVCRIDPDAFVRAVKAFKEHPKNGGGR